MSSCKPTKKSKLSHKRIRRLLRSPVEWHLPEATTSTSARVCQLLSSLLNSSSRSSRLTLGVNSVCRQMEQGLLVAVLVDSGLGVDTSTYSNQRWSAVVSHICSAGIALSRPVLSVEHLESTVRLSCGFGAFFVGVRAFEANSQTTEAATKSGGTGDGHESDLSTFNELIALLRQHQAVPVASSESCADRVQNAGESEDVSRPAPRLSEDRQMVEAGKDGSGVDTIESCQREVPAEVSQFLSHYSQPNVLEVPIGDKAERKKRILSEREDRAKEKLTNNA